MSRFPPFPQSIKGTVAKVVQLPLNITFGGIDVTSAQMIRVDLISADNVLLALKQSYHNKCET